MLLVGRGRGQHAHFVLEPAEPPRGLQLDQQRAIDVAQMRDVADRVLDLRRRQRASRPIGEARGLVDVRLADRLRRVRYRRPARRSRTPSRRPGCRTSAPARGPTASRRSRRPAARRETPSRRSGRPSARIDRRQVDVRARARRWRPPRRRWRVAPRRGSARTSSRDGTRCRRRRKGGCAIRAHAAATPGVVAMSATRVIPSLRAPRARAWRDPCAPARALARHAEPLVEVGADRLLQILHAVLEEMVGVGDHGVLDRRCPSAS